MNTIKRKCHMKALSEDLELGLIGGLLASAIDSYWVIMDAIHNGIHIHYVIILTVLLLSTAILAKALGRRHIYNVKQEIGVLYRTKKEINKRKLKRKIFTHS